MINQKPKIKLEKLRLPIGNECPSADVSLNNKSESAINKLSISKIINSSKNSNGTHEFTGPQSSMKLSKEESTS